MTSLAAFIVYSICTLGLMAMVLEIVAFVIVTKRTNGLRDMLVDIVQKHNWLAVLILIFYVVLAFFLICGMMYCWPML